eukprot:TRINITY_DN1838_c0_g1_i6.p1 TRINITY_DN1838_c0_g1~~TRINITY_DN1838_c0_g1_i6.p1  ORF type:complete len:328 (-),score=35.48 TRINITY_DN1838_c0_g1_i6:232-1215(-)
MIRRPPRSTHCISSAASDVYKRQVSTQSTWVLGWREYVRGVYWANMPGYEAQNYFDQQQPLPAWFWTGQTKMRCMAHAIGQSLEHAYAHHIQRLMIIGNFALLAGLNPAAVHGWYLGVYIDAFEWVELPNTVGMSQFADGGRLATKPYVSSAAYIDRMSDYCKGCHYDKKARVGERACPFNALYWDFFARNGERLSANPRLGMVYRQLAKMSPEALIAAQGRAEEIRAGIEALQAGCLIGPRDGCRASSQQTTLSVACFGPARPAGDRWHRGCPRPRPAGHHRPPAFRCQRKTARGRAACKSRKCDRRPGGADRPGKRRWCGRAVGR